MPENAYAYRGERFLNDHQAADHLEISRATFARWKAIGLAPQKRRWTREELDAIVVPPKKGHPHPKKKKQSTSAAGAAAPTRDEGVAPGPHTPEETSSADPPRSAEEAPGSQPETASAAGSHAPAAAPLGVAAGRADVNPKDPHQLNLPRPSRARPNATKRDGARPSETKRDGARPSAAPARPSETDRDNARPSETDRDGLQEEKFWW